MKKPPQIKYRDPQSREVLAIQWKKHGDHHAVRPEGMPHMTPTQGCIQTRHSGPMLVRTGDWIVALPDGDFNVVNPITFHTCYYPSTE